MHYMLTFVEPASDFARREDAAASPGYWGAWTSYIGAIAASGAMVSGNVLQPPSAATTVSVRDGARHVHDGPFADTKEQLGGYVILDAPDLDAALEWAARAPCASTGRVEVRAVMPPPPQG